MSDRALLEAAARAAGLDVLEQRSGGLPWTAQAPGGPKFGWNPLTDDGDALRLAVRLGVRIEPWLGEACGVIGKVEFGDGNAILIPANTDPMAATRRAIVRAAAALAGDARGGGEG